MAGWDMIERRRIWSPERLSWREGGKRSLVLPDL